MFLWLRLTWYVGLPRHVRHCVVTSTTAHQGLTGSAVVLVLAQASNTLLLWIYIRFFFDYSSTWSGYVCDGLEVGILQHAHCGGQVVEQGIVRLGVVSVACHSWTFDDLRGVVDIRDHATGLWAVRDDSKLACMYDTCLSIVMCLAQSLATQLIALQLMYICFMTPLGIGFVSLFGVL